jgi:hypothetical protein
MMEKKDGRYIDILKIVNGEQFKFCREGRDKYILTCVNNDIVLRKMIYETLDGISKEFDYSMYRYKSVFIL